VAQVEKEIGGVDILVNNAGIPNAMALAAFRTSSRSSWRRISRSMPTGR
jgi:NAD(P)-dependent dehydrogenase (short-subunit alcohol dehydrogenase family)